MSIWSAFAAILRRVRKSLALDGMTVSTLLGYGNHGLYSGSDGH